MFLSCKQLTATTFVPVLKPVLWPIARAHVRRRCCTRRCCATTSWAAPTRRRCAPTATASPACHASWCALERLCTCTELVDDYPILSLALGFETGCACHASWCALEHTGTCTELVDDLLTVSLALGLKAGRAYFVSWQSLEEVRTCTQLVSDWVLRLAGTRWQKIKASRRALTQPGLFRRSSGTN